MNVKQVLGLVQAEALSVNFFICGFKKFSFKQRTVYRNVFYPYGNAAATIVGLYLVL